MLELATSEFRRQKASELENKSKDVEFLRGAKLNLLAAWTVLISNKLTTRFGYKIAHFSLGYHRRKSIENHRIVYISSERVERGLHFKSLDFGAELVWGQISGVSLGAVKAVLADTERVDPILQAE